jgi:Tol biopolymer transport system component
VGYISAVAWSSPTELLYSQAESVAGDTAGSTARVILQDARSSATRLLLWSPSSGVVLDLLGAGRLVFDARSPRENLLEVPLTPAASRGKSRWLTRGNSTDRQPVYSPDGRRVVFASTRSGNFDLWQTDTRTGALRRLTEDRGDDYDPAFTSDGKKILWTSNRTGHFEIWTADADGTGARQLTHDGFDAENATATPDGLWVVYNSANPRNMGVWKIRIDGSDPILLVPGWNGLPEVSPDGQYALCSFGSGTKVAGVRVLRIADGSVVPFEIRLEVHRETTATIGRGRWMPGGRAIAFVGQDERGVNGVYVQDFTPGQDTTSTRRPLAGFDSEAATESFGISRDGSRIVVAVWEQLFSLMIADGVPGVAPPARSR